MHTDPTTPTQPLIDVPLPTHHYHRLCTSLPGHVSDSCIEAATLRVTAGHPLLAAKRFTPTVAMLPLAPSPLHARIGGLVSGRYSRDMFSPEECRQRHADIISRLIAVFGLQGSSSSSGL
jgi:hypothetical protein